MLNRLAATVGLVIALFASIVIASLPNIAFAQTFVPTGGYQTITNACGTYFLQGTTYYNFQGISVGSSLPFCPNPFSVQNSQAASFILAKYTNATLPTCNASSAGLVAIETDGAASPVYAATATGSGTLYVTVLCTNSNGTYNWTNH